MKGELFDNETDKAISALILLTTKNKLNIYASEGSQTLVLSNSQDSLFINKVISHLDDKDKIQIASAAIASSLIGSIIQRTSEDYRKKDGTFQHDKILHSNIGALINLGGVAGAYLAIETAGLGDQVRIIKVTKKVDYTFNWNFLRFTRRIW